MKVGYVVKKIIYIIVLIFSISSLYYSYILFKEKNGTRYNNMGEDINTNISNSDDNEGNKDIQENEMDNNTEIEIVAVGDFLIHKEILETQYDEIKDSYDFKNTVQYIKSYLENADLTIANVWLFILFITSMPVHFIASASSSGALKLGYPE